jgi:hypothetical protein
MNDSDLPARTALARALTAQSATLCQAVVAAQYALDPELMNRFGQAGYEKSLSDASYNVGCLAESVSMGAPHIFVDYCRWLQGVLVAAHVSPKVLPAHLELLLGRIEASVRPDEAEYLRRTRFDPAREAGAGGLP